MRCATLVLSVAAVLVLGAVGASSAAAESPWWQLNSGSRPAHIQPGSGHNEVQEVITTPEGEISSLEISVKGTPGEIFISNGEFGFPALTAANLQTYLEGPYGAGNVIVTEAGQGEEQRKFTITTINGSGYQQVLPVEVEEVGIGTVKANVVTKGRPDGEIFVTAENLGDAVLNAETDEVEITDTLPPGLRAVGVAASSPFSSIKRIYFPCDQPPAVLSCSFGNAPTIKGNGGEKDFNNHILAPYDLLEMRIAVVAEPGAESGEQNEVTISGGHTPSASLSRPVTLSSEATPFGIESFRMSFEEDGGTSVTRAGSHPFQFTTTVAINSGPATRRLFGEPGVLTAEKAEAEPAALPKDIYTKLPVGLIGNPTAIATCSLAQFLTNRAGAENACPPGSTVGVAQATVHEPSFAGQASVSQPLQNLETYPGEPARFGFYVAVAGQPVILDTSLRSDEGGDYGINVNATNISQAAGLSSATVSVWGVPGDPRHDHSRSFACLHESAGVEFEAQLELPPCRPAEEPHPPAFLTMPTSCSGPLQASVEGDAWIDPKPAGQRESQLPDEPLPALDSCNQLPFNPTIESEPTTSAATSPTGFNFDLNVPNDGLESADGLASSEIKKVSVTLPEGMSTNPSVAEGLHACSLAEFKATTILPGAGCTEESKIGDAEIESPVVNQTVKGSLFVAKQAENTYGNLLTLYLVFKNQELGILVKQALKVTPNPVTGQLTTEVDNVPQLPFSHFHLSFRQGQRSPLVSPPACGTYAVKADLYPYSDPDTPVHRESFFQITQGPEGQGCPNGSTPPFHPGLEAGTVNNAAGTYSPFYTHLSRKDSEQEITRFSIKLPPGVIGKLAGVSSCSDAAIAAAKAREHEGGGTEEENSPSCPANSEVGHSLVGSGVGNILAYAPGKLYLAGPYHGSNISLVSITAAKVGPFDLGTVVVRFALRIDPETAEVFVDSQGSDPIPHIVDGIPVHLRDIRAYVDRPNFTLNPTSCAKKSTASTVLGSGLNFASEADDQPVTVTSPFQAADCANLGFAPKLGLSLKGGTKRGATPAFKAVLTYPKGSYANIAKSVVTLPHSEFLEQSHIKTICTRVQFKEGKVPGEKCPKASIYGRAEARTPLLDEPLKGPVYLRSSSHNLPDLVAALHNNQVDFALAGRIDSVRNGRIRNTFETVPDAPVSKFVLEMQGGKKGLLVNSTNLCKQKNRAISEFTGQNGKLYNTKPVLSAKCGGKGKKKGIVHKRSGAHR